MRVIDISQTLGPRTPIWPGDTAFEARAVWTQGPDCPVTVSRVTLSTHMGAHADAPLHYDAAGRAIDQIDLTAYLGAARLIHRIGLGRPLQADDIAGALADRPERLLIRTFAAFPHEAWPRDWTPIAAGAIHAMAAAGVRLVGVDTPSLDPETSKSMEAHLAVRDAGLAILEGLVLDAAPEGDYELIALPLKLQGLDAAPVRAVLRTLR